MDNFFSPFSVFLFVFLKKKTFVMTEPKTQRSWQLLTIAVISYVIFIVTSSLTVWISFKTNHDPDTAKIFSLILLIASIILPLVYFIFTFLPIKKSGVAP